MLHNFFSSINFYLLIIDILIFFIAIYLVVSVFHQKRHESTSVSEQSLLDQQIIELRDALHIHEQRIMDTHNQLIANIAEKVEALSGRSSAIDLKLSEIKNLLVGMDTGEPQAVNKSDDTAYRYARKLLNEGQSIDVVIQQTNLSRDEVNILKNLLA